MRRIKPANEKPHWNTCAAKLQLFCIILFSLRLFCFNISIVHVFLKTLDDLLSAYKASTGAKRNGRNDFFLNNLKFVTKFFPYNLKCVTKSLNMNTPSWWGKHRNFYKYPISNYPIYWYGLNLFKCIHVNLWVLVKLQRRIYFTRKE